MENKYYTPSIEEFHVGFEYERSFHTGWETKIFDDGFEDTDYSPLYWVNWELHKGLIRVKYLDKEDIESLGFRYDKTHPGTASDYFEYGSSEFSFEHAEYYMDYDSSTNYCRIYFSVLDGDSTVFAGTIKNKSELKVLLKQLGINEAN